MGAYSNLLLNLVPVAYWRLGDTVGTVAVDEMRVDHGTYAGTYTLGVTGALTGDVDKAVTFNGATGSHVTIPNSAVLAFGAGPFTCSLWAKRADAAAGYQMLWAKGTQGNIYFQNNQLVLDNDTGGQEPARTVGTFTDTLWHHLVVTHSGTGAGNTKIYKDGVSVSITEPAPNAATSTNAFTAALAEYYANGGGTLAFNGSLDEVAVWSRALTAVEVANLYAAAIGTAGTFDTITVALAARFNAAAITAAGGPPTGLTNVRLSTGDLPNTIDALPCVLVFPDSGKFMHSAGKRDSEHDFLVRFYYTQATDLRRDMIALRLWLAILVDQLKLSAQLAGIVTQAKVMTWKIGTLDYGDAYTGIELGVSINVNEAWSPVA